MATDRLSEYGQEELRFVILDLQAQAFISDARYWAMFEVVQILCKVSGQTLFQGKDFAGKDLKDTLSFLTDREIDSKLAMQADRNPQVAAALKQHIATLRPGVREKSDDS